MSPTVPVILVFSSLGIWLNPLFYSFSGLNIQVFTTWFNFTTPFDCVLNTPDFHPCCRLRPWCLQVQLWPSLHFINAISARLLPTEKLLIPSLWCMFPLHPKWTFYCGQTKHTLHFVFNTFASADSQTAFLNLCKFYVKRCSRIHNRQFRYPKYMVIASFTWVHWVWIQFSLLFVGCRMNTWLVTSLSFSHLFLIFCLPLPFYHSFNLLCSLSIFHTQVFSYYFYDNNP
jgi:hypothetical protein